MQQVTRINAARFKGIPAEKAARFKKKQKMGAEGRTVMSARVTSRH